MFKKYQITLLTTTLVLSMFCAKSIVAANMALGESAAYASFIQTLVSNSSIARKGSFCILGNDAVARALSKGAGNITLREDTTDFRHCRAVYVSVENIVNLKVQLSELAENKILTVGTFDEFVENGGMIQVEMGRRDFELLVDVRALNTAQIKLDTLSTNLIVN